MALWAVLAIETGAAFVVAATLAVWARRGFPTSRRVATASSE